MDVGEFSYSMADNFINSAADLSALDVADVDVHMHSGYGGGEIRSDVKTAKNNIGLKFVKNIWHAHKSSPHPFYHGGAIILVVFRENWKDDVDFKTVFFNYFFGFAEML